LMWAVGAPADTLPSPGAPGLLFALIGFGEVTKA